MTEREGVTEREREGERERERDREIVFMFTNKHALKNTRRKYLRGRRS